MEMKTLNGYEIVDAKAREAIEELKSKGVDLSNYYTKEEVNNAIANIDIPDTDLSNYYTKEQIDEGYYNKGEVDSTLGGIEMTYATIEYVDEKVADIPAGNSIILDLSCAEDSYLNVDIYNHQFTYDPVSNDAIPETTREGLTAILNGNYTPSSIAIKSDSKYISVARVTKAYNSSTIVLYPSVDINYQYGRFNLTTAEYTCSYNTDTGWTIQYRYAIGSINTEGV